MSVPKAICETNIQDILDLEITIEGKGWLCVCPPEGNHKDCPYTKLFS